MFAWACCSVISLPVPTALGSVGTTGREDSDDTISSPLKSSSVHTPPSQQAAELNQVVLTGRKNQANPFVVLRVFVLTVLIYSLFMMHPALHKLPNVC